MNVLRRCFWAGFVSALAIESLVQDALGRDRYLATARDGWMSAWVTVPLAIVILLGAAATMAYVEHRAES